MVLCMSVQAVSAPTRNHGHDHLATLRTDQPNVGRAWILDLCFDDRGCYAAWFHNASEALLVNKLYDFTLTVGPQ
jgi:hypothetical protein